MNESEGQVRSDKWRIGDRNYQSTSNVAIFVLICSSHSSHFESQSSAGTLRRCTALPRGHGQHCADHSLFFSKRFLDSKTVQLVTDLDFLCLSVHVKSTENVWNLRNRCKKVVISHRKIAHDCALCRTSFPWFSMNSEARFFRMSAKKCLELATRCGTTPATVWHDFLLDSIRGEKLSEAMRNTIKG